MPIIALLALIALAILIAIALLPLSLVQRYRMGTARRPARAWVATLNVLGLSASIGLFLLTAAITSAWVPDALPSTIAGLAAGCTLGLTGLALTRWEPTPRALYYTPNRWLVLGITLVVTLRLLYGFWRAWDAWRAHSTEESWLAAAGVAGSMAAGAVVLGYYVTYWFGIHHRLRSHQGD